MSCLSFRRNPHHGSSCLFAHGRLLPAYSSASGGTPIPRPLTLPCVLFLSGYDFLFYGILRIWIFLALPCVLFVSIHDLHFNGIFRVWASSFNQPRSAIWAAVHLFFPAALWPYPRSGFPTKLEFPSIRFAAGREVHDEPPSFDILAHRSMDHFALQ